MNSVFTYLLCFLTVVSSGNLLGYSSEDSPSAKLKAVTILAEDTSEDKDFDFMLEAKRLKIPARTIYGLEDIYNGYYLIAGVFGEKSNASRFATKLRNKDLKPQILYNSKNKLHYVQLAYHRTGRQAIKTCMSKLNGQYKEAIWILNVQKSKPIPLSENKAVRTSTTSQMGKEAFLSTAKKYGISARVISALDGFQNGYYLIAGVYGEKSNARKHLLRLQQTSLKPQIIQNPDNGMHYVYLSHQSEWQKAIEQCHSNFDGQYNKKMWILAILGEVQKQSRLVSKDLPAEKAKQESFEELIAKYNIPMRSDPGFAGLSKGYYLVAGVFGDKDNAITYLKKVKRSYPMAGIAIQEKSGLNFLYLKRYQDGKKAITNYLNKLDGGFKDPMWILAVEPSSPQTVENKARSITAKESTDPFRPMAKANKPVVNDKLLEKADSFFDKMWYAEAAELYELILDENPENRSFEIIRKAGDAHYFNTNMERAFHWYDILYNQYKSEMRSDNLFKYAHTLKGTGKYGRAKRLMKLYNKALKEEGSKRSYRTRPNEAALDNILSTELEYDIKNVGINSEYSDFSPMFYQDNKVVYASAKDSAFFSTRRYKWNDQPYLDLYVAKLNEEEDDVKSAVKFSKKINTKYHEAAVTFSPDQQTIYFTRNNYGKKLKRDKKGINNLKIYMSRKTGDSWSEAVELPFNSDEYSTGHPALSPDGTKLYFVSDMPGSIGKTDLFVVDVMGDGQFSEPRNLGPEINTERREMFPFFSGDKLYFASDGHVGLGGLDIYEVAVTEEGFSEVVNMGKPINSRKDDFSYIVNEETQKGFFASNRRGGKGDDDIYSFRKILPEEPNLNAIAGVVTEMVSGEVMPSALVVLLDENNMKLKEMETAEDGSFVFEELDSNTRYIIRTVKESYSADEQEISTLENERIEMAVNMNKLEERIVVEEGIRKLKTDIIYFDFDKFNIRSDAAAELDNLVEVMKTYPKMVIKIESHTDSRGKRAYNKYLSDKRAKSTRDYLISKGIDPKRIESAIGYGEERLLNECNGSVRCSSAKHQLNRRSEFIIVNM